VGFEGAGYGPTGVERLCSKDRSSTILARVGVINDTCNEDSQSEQ